MTRKNHVPASVFREEEAGLGRVVTVVSHLSTPQVFVQSLVFLSSFVLGLGGGIAGLWVTWMLSTELVTTSAELGVAGYFLAAFSSGIVLLGILVFSFLWFIKVAVEWPTEQNDIARAMFGVLPR